MDYKLNTVAVYSYNAWGEILSVTDSLGNEITDESHIANINPIIYRGYYYDTETGFYYCGSRYYNPVFCRWINADGYASTGQGLLGCNMYAYCGNNPVNYIDSDGEFPVAIGAGVATVAAIAALCALAAEAASEVYEDVYRFIAKSKTKSFSETDSKEKEIEVTGNSRPTAPTYYHVTTMENALAIQASKIMQGNKWEAGLVHAWRLYPSKKALKQSGAHFGVIISFKTNTAFVRDLGIDANTEAGRHLPVVSARPGPIAVWDVQILEVIG